MTGYLKTIVGRHKNKLRTLAKGDDVVNIYARMVLAVSAGKGCRISLDELDLILSQDDAVAHAVAMAIQDETDKD